MRTSSWIGREAKNDLYNKINDCRDADPADMVIERSQTYSLPANLNAKQKIESGLETRQAQQLSALEA